MSARVIAAIVLFCGLPVCGFAQGSGGLDHVFLVSGQYGAPMRLAGTAGVLIAPPKPLKPGTSPDSSRMGVLLRGGAGGGGFRADAGLAALALEGPWLTTGFDALFTVTRTTASPRDASPNATYLGGEAGLVLMSVRVAAGVAHRVGGTSGPTRTIFTWSVGVQLPLGWRSPGATATRPRTSSAIIRA